jgi:hypothetical protein
MQTLLALALIGYLPGALIFRGPWLDRERRAGLRAEERGFWAVVLSVVIALAVTLALAAAGAYRFERLLGILAVISLLIAGAARGRLRLGPPSRRPSVSASVPIALVAAGLWLYFPPAEFVIGGKDPGVYMNEGIQIAQRGSLEIRDRVVASVPANLRELFFPSHQRDEYYGLRFMGFFIREPGAGTVIGQFPHLYPASIAVGYGLNGLSGARQAAGAWTILGLVAVYLLGARLFGPVAGALGSALLAANVVVVWFARYPNAEVVMLALLFAALLALARATVDGDRFFGPVAGALLGLLMFLRVDAVLALGAVGAAVALGLFSGRRPRAGFYLAVGVTLALAALYLGTLMRAYLWLPIVFTQHLGAVWYAGVGLVALLALWALSRHATARALVTRWTPPALALVLLVLAAYAWFLREQGGRLAYHDAEAFRTFAWYVTSAGLLAAVAGVVVLLPRFFWRDPGFFLTMAVFASFFFYKIRIVPDHFWMTRRFLPVILPAALLLMAALAVWIVDPRGLAASVRRVRGGHGSRDPGTIATSSGSRARAAATLVLASALVAPLFLAFWRASSPLLHHVEFAGLIPRLEQLADRFGRDDLIVFESRNASDVHVLALPLAYIYDRSTIVLNSPAPDKVAFEGFLAEARRSHPDVYFLGGGGTDLLTRRIAVEPVFSERFQVPEYESSWNAYPRGVRHKEFDYGVYRFVDGPPKTGPFALSVGELDDLHVVRFHAKERDGSGRTFRWSRDVSYVALDGIDRSSRTVTLWMANGNRPRGAGPAVVRIALMEEEIGEVEVGPEERPYAFALPMQLVGRADERDEPMRLRLSASTWNPRHSLAVPDERDLGVMVTRVEVR